MTITNAKDLLKLLLSKKKQRLSFLKAAALICEPFFRQNLNREKASLKSGRIQNPSSCDWQDTLMAYSP